MKTAGQILKILNTILDFVVGAALLLAGIYSVYVLWDNQQVYHAAENVKAEMLVLKPDPEEENGESFEELRNINPNVCAWLTLDHTKIDYPILQGTDNLSYINTDVYGNFALAGSIFLDSRNDGAFYDPYSLLYGHHMENRKMFGDLDLYRDKKFFAENSSGILILPDRSYHLEIFACLSVSASEAILFDPVQWRADNISSKGGLLDFVANHSLCLRPDALDLLSNPEKNGQILAMTTCSSDFTDARTVVLAVMEPISPKT